MPRDRVHIMITVVVGILPFSVGGACFAKSPNAHPVHVPARPKPRAKDRTLSCIDEKLVDEMFASIRKRGKWNMEGPMVWGYFFLGRAAEDLRRARSLLEREGYRFVEIFPPEPADGEFLTLHMERVEVHTAATLKARNLKLCALASELNLQSYDGMDVGPVPTNAEAPARRGQVNDAPH